MNDGSWLSVVGVIFAFEEKIRGRLTELFSRRGVTLDSFAIRKIDFDPDFVQAIEQQQIAHENIETARYQSEAAIYEAKRAAELAKGEAQARIERTRGDAAALRIQAQADAEAIQLRGRALEAYPEVLKLEMIGALDSAKWMMLPSDGITPLLPLEP